MSKNRSRVMQQAIVHLDRLLPLEDENYGALPGSALGHAKEARRILLKDIRKRRENRERESFRRTKD